MRAIWETIEKGGKKQDLGEYTVHIAEKKFKNWHNQKTLRIINLRQ